MENIRNAAALLAIAFFGLVAALPALHKASDAIVPEHDFDEYAPVTRMLEEKTETKASVTTSTILAQAKNDLQHKCFLVKPSSTIQTNHASGQGGNGDETFASLASMAVSSSFECAHICTSLDESALTFSNVLGFGLTAAGQAPSDEKLMCRGEAPESGSAATTQCGPLEGFKAQVCSSEEGTQLLQQSWGGALITSGSFTMMASSGVGYEAARVVPQPVTTSTVLAQAKSDIQHKCFLVKPASTIQTNHASGQGGNGDETFATLASMAVSSSFECVHICTSLDESALTFSNVLGFGVSSAGQTASSDEKLFCRGEAPESGSAATTQCGPLEGFKAQVCNSEEGTQLLQAGVGNIFSGALLTSGSFTMMASSAF